MNIKNQVLSLEQIQELIDLGFDIKKYASMYYSPNWITKFRVDEIQDYLLQIGELGEDYDGDCIPTMTIGDIINILPFSIDEYHFLSINPEYCKYSISDYIGIVFFTHEKEIINNLFNTLIWCIKEKHIKL